MNDKEECMLSIYVPVYNHEKYIVQALDSILMQKTKYKYEVLVGEDASTDNTRAILKEYEKKHPGKFQIFYRQQNMHNSSCRNGRDLRLRCKGKYVLGLEGDDFWIDENKIEKEIDFLESHPEYLAVAHNCIVVGEDSQPNGETYPECKDVEYTMEHFICGIYPGQLTTVMTRNFYTRGGGMIDTSLISKRLSIGDGPLYFSCIANGRVYCMQEAMSAYRHVTQGGSSFSANFKYSYENQVNIYKAYMDYAYKISNRKAIVLTEFLYVKITLGAFKRKELSFKECFSSIKIIKYRWKVCLCYLKYIVNRKIFQREKYL